MNRHYSQSTIDLILLKNRISPLPPKKKLNQCRCDLMFALCTISAHLNQNCGLNRPGMLDLCLFSCVHAHKTKYFFFNFSNELFHSSPKELIWRLYTKIQIILLKYLWYSQSMLDVTLFLTCIHINCIPPPPLWTNMGIQTGKTIKLDNHNVSGI